MIYFIRNGHFSAVKIGHAIDPLKRLRQFQTASPDLLSLVAVAPGGRKEEAELHARFEDSNIRGEWFRETPSLLATIESLAGPVLLAGLADLSRKANDIRFDFPEVIRWPGWATPQQPVNWGVAKSTGQVFVDGKFVGLSSRMWSWSEFGYAPTQMISINDNLLMFEAESLLEHAHGIGPAYVRYQDTAIARVLHSVIDHARSEFSLCRPAYQPCDCVLCSGRIAQLTN